MWQSVKYINHSENSSQHVLGFNTSRFGTLFTDWSVKCDSIHDFESLIKCNFMVNKERKLIDEILFLMYA